VLRRLPRVGAAAGRRDGLQAGLRGSALNRRSREAEAGFSLTYIPRVYCFVWKF
jgi:hypothetical protein